MKTSLCDSDQQCIEQKRVSLSTKEAEVKKHRDDCSEEKQFFSAYKMSPFLILYNNIFKGKRDSAKGFEVPARKHTKVFITVIL